MVQTIGFCLGVVTVFFGVFLLTPSKRKQEEDSIERSLIGPTGAPATPEELEESTSSNASLCSAPPGSALQINGGRARGDSRVLSSFSNCGLSVDGDAHSSVSVERLVSLTYMPVVVNDPNLAFYMDRAFVTPSTPQLLFSSPSALNLPRKAFQSDLTSTAEELVRDRHGTEMDATSSSKLENGHDVAR